MLFSLASLAALGCATPGAAGRPGAAAALGGAADPRAYLPLAVGAEWTYEAKGGGKTSRDTIRIVGRDGAWFLDDHRGRIRYEADGVRDRDRYLLRAPLVPGRGWTAVENLVVQRFEVAAVDARLTVPAGTYEKVLVIRNDQALPNGVRYVTEWSYAPGVGLVSLRTSTLSGGRTQEQTSLQLVGFKAGTAGP